MFQNKDYERGIDNDEIVTGSSFGGMDFDSQDEEIPEWLGLDEVEFLTPGAVKQAEDETENPHFLLDTPRDAFTDRVTREIIEFDPHMNPTFIAGREYLLSDRSDLIRDGATMLRDVMSELRPGILMSQPHLERIAVDEVQSDGHILKGTISWTVEFASSNQPGVRRSQQSTPTRKTRVEIPIRIREGMLKKPAVFYTASSRPYPLTVAGCQLVLNWKDRPISQKRIPQVELSQQQERDYRAF